MSEDLGVTSPRAKSIKYRKSGMFTSERHQVTLLLSRTYLSSTDLYSERLIVERISHPELGHVY